MRTKNEKCQQQRNSTKIIAKAKLKTK